MTIMSFLALNLQVAEASVAMHEMPIATAAKEIAIRQAMAFPFLEDVCIGRTRPSERWFVIEERARAITACRMLCRRNSSGSSNRAGGRLHALTLSARWPAPLVEPGAVFAHPLALRCRRVALAGRSLVALRRRAPTQLDAVVGVVCHLEIDRTVDHIAQRECPRGAVAARIRELARRQLGREHAQQFGLHLRDALALRHRVALGSPRDPIRKAEHHVDCNQ